MKNRFFSILALSAAFAGAFLMCGCQKDSDTDNTFKLTIAPYSGNGKVYIDDDGYSCWDHADQVYINSQPYAVQISNHSCTISGVAPSSTGSYTAVFPASIVADNAVLSGTTVSGLTLPAVQEYQVDGFGHQKVPSYMAAYLGSYSGTIQFAHAGIALQLTVSNSYSRAIVLSQVVVSDNLAPLSGSFSITGLADGTPQLVAAAGNTDTSVTLNIPSGIELNPGESAVVTVVLPPTDDYAANKFTIRVCGFDKAHLQDGVSTLYEFTQCQNSNATGAIPRNTLAPVPVSLQSPHTLVLKGLGTEANPYKIYSPNDLLSMQRLVNGGYPTLGSGNSFAHGYYKLMSDIDMTGHTLAPIGSADNNFSGTFVGCGHTISNLTVVGAKCAGLFGYVPYGTISYLNVCNANLTATADKDFLCGTICAKFDWNARVKFCHVSGTVQVNTGAGVGFTGGLFGYSYGAFQNCKFTGVLDCHNSTSSQYVGGIVGYMRTGMSNNAYVYNQTTANNILGGNATTGGIIGFGYDGSINAGYFGATNVVSGMAGRTADICGYRAQTVIRYCAYPTLLCCGEAVTNTLNHQYTPNGTDLYLYNNTSPVVNLLNSNNSFYGTRVYWSAPDNATPPEINFTYSE